MRARPTLAVVATLAIAACDGSPTDNSQRPTTPVDPMTAQAASTGCSNRCGYVLPVTGTGTPVVFRVTEDARVQGRYDTPTSSAAVFTWGKGRGTQTVVLREPAPGKGVVPVMRNNWGQSVGSDNFPLAAAWEPDGTGVYLRGPDRLQVIGGAVGINENSVIIGTGYLPPDNSDLPRPFRWHHRDGFQYLLPDGYRGAAIDINNAGTILGTYTNHYRSSASSWFIWTPAGGRQEMGWGRGLAISENGHIAGYDAGGTFLRTPQGERLQLPEGYLASDVNDWGEVVLVGNGISAGADGTCGSAVWYRGYGLVKLRSPVPDAPLCFAVSINSWGDVVGTVGREVVEEGQPKRFEHQAVVVWTWKNNAYRYVAQ